MLSLPPVRLARGWARTAGLSSALLFGLAFGLGSGALLGAIAGPLVASSMANGVSPLPVGPLLSPLLLLPLRIR